MHSQSKNMLIIHFLSHTFKIIMNKTEVCIIYIIHYHYGIQNQQSKYNIENELCKFIVEEKINIVNNAVGAYVNREIPHP